MDAVVTQAKILELISEAFAMSEDESSFYLVPPRGPEHEMSLLALFEYIKNRLKVIWLSLNLSLLWVEAV